MNEFINFSNHPAESWSESQLQAAQAYGAVADYPFPNVPAEADEQTVESLSASIAEEIALLKPAAVMCQGEFTLSFAVCVKLCLLGITVVSACSKRETVVTLRPDGTTEKNSVFRFVRFREFRL